MENNHSSPLDPSARLDPLTVLSLISKTTDPCTAPPLSESLAEGERRKAKGDYRFQASNLQWQSQATSLYFEVLCTIQSTRFSFSLSKYLLTLYLPTDLGTGSSKPSLQADTKAQSHH